MTEQVKLVVWDLDNTLWRGVLLEDSGVSVDERAVAVVRELDRRGILQSVASRNDPDTAMQRLAAAGLADLFLLPQIGWGAKSDAIARLAQQLGLALEAVAFVDDDPFERAEVAAAHPAVRTYDAADLVSLPQRPELVPAFVTAESAQRRLLYGSQQQRDRVAAEWTGPPQEFLASLGMVFRVWPASPDDLRRAEELTVRTHQLNTTGRSYSYAELVALHNRDDVLLLVASLTDRFGSYGTIGLALVDKAARRWRVRLLLMSCRILSRGVGSVLLGEVMRAARRAGATLEADLVPNERNRQMLVTLRLAGFREVGREGDVVVLHSDLVRLPGTPSYVELVVDGTSDSS